MDHDGTKYPSTRIGEDVENVQPRELNSLYDEARDCFSVNAFTAVAQVCRTIIAHIAVEKGAASGQSFKHYMEFLRDNYYIPKGSDVWVDSIRDVGNLAIHDLNTATEGVAETVLKFTEMLLKITFEYPAAAEKLKGSSG